ncbi:MAG: polysaccharide deacetylase family protein [Clostridia bacterium]|nr:polysaccharide deacetylase family protein [Clostridia bacterium]
MKRSISLFLSFILVLLSSLTLFSGCGQKDSYVITFSVNGEKTTVEVPKGEVPEYIGETSWETSEHFYKITGWDKEFAPAASDTTYTATVGEYGLTLYDVLFILGGNKLVTIQTHEGEIPTPPEGYETDEQPTKIGTFKSWDKELVAPTAENTKNGAVKMTYRAVYTYEPKYLASILTAKDGAKGVLTLTYDDGIYSTGVWVNQMNKKYGLKGSFMLVPHWGDEDRYQNFGYAAGSISKWKTLFAEGTLEPESHSMTHDMLPFETYADYEKYKGNCYQEKYQYELVQSKEMIEAAFGTPCLCFAPGYNTLSTKSYAVKANGELDFSRQIADGGAEKVACETYYAIRRGNRTTVQTLNPPMGTNAGAWHNLAIKAFKDSDSKETSVRCGWIDAAVRNGNWLIIMCHGIKGEGASDAGDLTTEEAEAFYSHASTYVKSGDLWCATFGEATKYIRERQNTTVTERYDKENNVVYVDMTINRTAEDGMYLTENVFNYPLTVEVRVPTTWKNVRYVDNGKTYTATPYLRDGGAFVKVNLTPGADGVTVTTAIRLPS